MKRKKLLSSIIALGMIISLVMVTNSVEAVTEDSFNKGIREFTDNHNLIMSHEEYGTVYTDVGYSSLGHLIETETPTLETDSPELQKIEASIQDKSGLPSSIDLSADLFFPPIGDQGDISSCASWATTYYQFTYQVARMNQWDAYHNTSYRFSPKWSYNFNNSGLDEGSTISNNIYILWKSGAARYNSFTPTGINTPLEYLAWCTNSTVYKNALSYRVSEYNYLSFANINQATPITGPNSTALVGMKSLLNTGHVLSFSVDFSTLSYVQLMNQYDNSLNGQYACIRQADTNNEYDGHAMTIVGYDDNIWVDLNGNGTQENYEKGAIKIANSHGTGYRNGGFVWVMYDALNRLSNTSAQNVTNRGAFIEDYAYYYIEVEEYPLDLIAEVTIKHKYRNEIDLRTGISSVNGSFPLYQGTTFLAEKGGLYCFNGNSNIYCTTKFVFDYDPIIFSSNTIRENVYITIEDTNVSGNNIPTKVEKIKLIDRTGHVVAQTNSSTSFQSVQKYFGFTIGMVGDVDNNGQVTIIDATKISQKLAGIITFSDEDMIVADADGDGNVTVMDATHIQRYLAGIIPELSGGLYAGLDQFIMTSNQS